MSTVPLPDPLTVDVYHWLPKADLHCHLIGTVAPQTVRELSTRDGVTWDPPIDAVYAGIDSLPPVDQDYSRSAVPICPPAAGAAGGHSLLAVTERVEDLLHERSDFVRVGYEAVTAAQRDAGTVHLELQVEVGAYLRRGVAYADVIGGLVEGLDAARAETGVSSVLIAAIDRSRSAEEARQVVQTLIDQPHERMVGIGLDNLETVGPPERFVEAFALAAKHGLHRTAHAGEHVPSADNVRTCLDLLGCERIDHGYFVLEDAALTTRVADEGIPFTCINTTSRRSWQSWRRASIAAMIEAGVAVVLASDDPAMFPTTLAAEYAIAADALGLPGHSLVRIAERSFEAAWVDDARRREMTMHLHREIEAVLHPAATTEGTVP